MDHEAKVKYNVLESMLLDSSIEPTDLPLSLLKYITNDFSDDQQIGSGGSSIVYKGVLGNRTVAIKKFNNTLDILEKNFTKEVGCLMKTKHKNVVRLLGYCSDTRRIIEDHKGKLSGADVRQWLLCFECLPKKSLDKYISGASCILEWRTLYEIIKGICEGLHYLHVNRRIVHLDLTPANILLDHNMIPKIADFGLSICFDEKQSRAFTSNLTGTIGYRGPECLSGEVTFSSDIYSLGVTIREIVTGKKGHLEVVDVLDMWTEKLEPPHESVQLEQIRVCTEIGIECAESDPAKRPDIQSIIDRLNGTANIDTSTPNTVQGETSSEVMATTHLVLYGKSSEDQHRLASTASSLSLEEGEVSISFEPDVDRDDKGFDASTYMGMLRACRFGRWMLWSPRIASTHDLVDQNFAKLPVGVVCIAETQFKGKGRSKNGWTSPPGCLMFSFTLRMNDSRKQPFLQYVVCIAMVEAVKELSCAKGLPELDIKIKWPNDLYLKGLKVGGILYTSVYQPMVHNICIGIGLNVDNKNPTTCLNAALHELKANSPRLKREDILASFFNKFEATFDTFSYKGFRALEERYYNAWLHSGQRIVVQDGNEGGSVGSVSVVTIQGLTRRGYLHAIGEDGKSYEVHSDGNSFIASRD